MTDSITITITIEELVLYKLGMQEALEIIYPGQLSFILLYCKGSVYHNALGDIYGNIFFVLK